MSDHYTGSNPPPYEASSQWAPPPYQPLYPPLPSQSQQPQVPTYPYFVPGMMAVPVGVSLTPPSYQPNPTYISNHIFHGESSSQETPTSEPIQFVGSSKDFDWVLATPCTASHLTGKAVIGGYEGDGSPLWVIRARHKGNLIPGNFSLRNKAATLASGSKEVYVLNIEVLCAPSQSLQWVPANKGNIPPNAVEGGKTKLGTTLYVGRVRYQNTVTLGYVNPRNKCCYIGFGGSSVFLQAYA